MAGLQRGRGGNRERYCEWGEERGVGSLEHLERPLFCSENHFLFLSLDPPQFTL